MTPQPLVSVITPIRDQAAFALEVVESVQAQSYGNVEHIVIDGGSTDGTLDVLSAASRGDTRIRIVSEPDDGIYDAVNKGLRLSRGQVLAYLNADDKYFPWSIEVAVMALAQQPDCGLVWGDVLNLDLATGRGTILFYPSLTTRTFLRSGHLGQPAVFWTRDVMNASGLFDSDLQFAGDTDYWMRVARRFPMARIDEVLALEGERPDRVSRHPVTAAVLQAELRSVLGSGDRHCLGHMYRVRDRVEVALLHRALQLRFARATRTGHRVPGVRWGGFLGDDDYRVDLRGLCLNMLPFAGRGRTRYVS